MSITYSSCFYIIKSKFDPSTYIRWMNHFLSIVNHFYLVIYTDEKSSHSINTQGNPRIKIVIKPLEQFYNHRYKGHWIRNHEKNVYLNQRIDWSVNMLWSEKVWFVKDTYDHKYFDSDYYGWCDIGYFRINHSDLPSSSSLQNWSNPEKIRSLDPSKIHYACINNNREYLDFLCRLIRDKKEQGLPRQPIPGDQCSIAGGFFIAHKDKLDWWVQTYDDRLKRYFEYDYLVKDDQIILADCIFSDQTNSFSLYFESDPRYDNWFLFQRLLS